MRPISRAAGLLALAVAAITCTDAPTGPRAQRAGSIGGRLALAPNFSPAALKAYGALETMGVSVTQVRIRLRTASGMLARDTTIQFGVQDTLHLQLPIEIQGTEQTFSALIELLDASGLVLFSQTQNVTARAVGLPAGTPPVITLEYVGPGALARALTVNPAALTVQPGTLPVLTATAADVAGAPVAGLLLGWTSSDAQLATVTAVGPVATVHGTGKRGTVTITAITPTGLSASSQLSMLPLAARLAVVSGAAQTSLAGRLLGEPLVVELQGVDGGPIPGAAVSFRAVTAGAVVGTTTTTTDAAGRASTTLSLGPTAGTYAFEVTSGSLTPLTVTATATALPAVALAVLSGSAQVDSIGSTLAPLVVRATDEFGAPAAGATIAWGLASGLGTLANATSITDANGQASVSYTLGSVLASSDTLTASLEGAGATTSPVVFTVRSILRGPNGLAIISGGGQSGASGTVLGSPLVAVVSDKLDNRVAGVSVQWQSSVAGLVTFATPVSVSDANGEVRTAVTLGTIAGTATVKATAGALAASTTLGVDVAAATLFGLIQPAPTSLTVGIAPTAPVVVRLDDASGKPVNAAGVVVTATLTMPPATTPLYAVTATTDASGIATLALPAYRGVVGTAALTITASGIAPSVSAPISLLPGVAASIAALPYSTTGLLGLALSIAPSVIVRDSSGNPVPGVPIAFSALNGIISISSATTDASGKASVGSWILTVLGENVATAASGVLAGSPVTFRANGTAGTPTGLKFISSPSSTTVGAMLSTVLVAIVDASGNVVTSSSDSIVVGLGLRDASLSGTTGMRAVNGVATFSGLVVGTAGDAYQLEARSGPLGPALSDPFDVTPALVTGIVSLVSGPNQLLPVRGTLAADSVAFVVRDPLQQPLAGVPVTFQLGELSQCTLAISPTVTDANGVIMRAVSAGNAPGACEITASYGDSRATAKVGVHDTGATHVWFGGTIASDRDFGVPSNWLTVSDRKQAVPMAADVPLIPSWESNPGPQLHADAVLSGLRMQPFAAIDLNGFTLNATGDVSAANASAMNGRMIAGGNGIRVSGQFDRLEVGRVDFCNNDAATLDVLSAKVLLIVCKVAVAANVVADTLDASGVSDLSIMASATLATGRGASVTGDRLNVSGTLSAGTGAMIAPTSVSVASGGRVQTGGRLTIGSSKSSVDFSKGSTLSVVGDAMFDGSGTLSADVVTLQGKTVFTGTGSWTLPDGELHVAGDLEVQGTQSATFSPSGSHLTRFTGAKAQTVTFAAGTGSFMRASVENRGDTVTFTGPIPFTLPDGVALDIAPGSNVSMRTGQFDIASGVNVGKSASLIVNGNVVLGQAGVLRLYDSAQLWVNEGWGFTGSCTQTIDSVLSVGVKIAGLGTINTKPIDALSCTP
jgi:hypothetical protein